MRSSVAVVATLRPQLKLSAEEIEHLEQLRDSRTAPWRETQRARIMLRYHSGEPIAQIARAIGMTRKILGKWVNKARYFRLPTALFRDEGGDRTQTVQSTLDQDLH